MIGAGQVGGLRPHPRAVLDPATHPGGRLPDGGRPTGRAPARLDPVLGHHRARRWRRRLEHLPRLLGGHQPTGKVTPTPRTDRRGTHDPMVRIGHLRQRRARRAGLLAGLTARAAPQRPVGRLARLLGVGAIGAGRPVGVGGVPPRLPLQPHDPLAKHHHLRPQLGQLRVPCRQLGLMQLGLAGQHHPQLGIDRTLAPQRRTQLLDRQGGQFARRLGHARDDQHPANRRSTRPPRSILSTGQRSPAAAFTLAE
jgi:hypothetical protein